MRYLEESSSAFLLRSNMSVFINMLMFLFLLCFVHGGARNNKNTTLSERNVVPRVPVSISDTVDCTGIVPVPLAGNSPANELVRSYCTGRCAEVTGQSIIPRPATFDFILASIDTVGDPGTLTTLTPLELLVCGYSLEEINQRLWPLLIRAGVCDTKASCGLDEDVELVDASTGEISCNQYPERETANPFALDAITIVFGILLIAVMLLIAGLSWYRVTVSKEKLTFEQKKFVHMKRAQASQKETLLRKRTPKQTFL